VKKGGVARLRYFPVPSNTLVVVDTDGIGTMYKAIADFAS
jgi:hypothetical protein